MESQSINIKKTPLNAVHHALGGKMAPFAGYEMPVQYAGINHEHETVRNAAGVFDVSHMGEILIQGKDALALIQKISSNDASVLFPGKVQYSCMPNKTGGIVDDLLIYMMTEKDYLLVVNASNIQKDLDWINAIALDYLDISITNLSDVISLLAVQGPIAAKFLQKLTNINLAKMKYYTFEIGEFAGIPNAIVSATGYTGAGGFEIYVQNQHAEKLWDSIFQAGKEYNIEPIGLAARDTLRLEMGYCLYGNEINDATSPLEAGLGWITKFSKAFVSSHLLKIQKAEGVSRKLVGFEMADKGIPRHDCEIWNENQQIIGIVTSGTMSPTLKKAIGIGYVNIEKSAIGSEIFINIRNRPIKAIVVQTPFI